MDNQIAGLTLIATRPNEPPQPIIVKIGTPHQVGPDEWVCPAEIEGLHGLMPIHGGDSFQSLCLAIRLVLQLLQSFRDNGGTLEFSGPATGEDLLFPLEAYGIAPRNPGQAPRTSA